MSSSTSKLFVYDGSKLLEPITNVLGIPIDQVRVSCVSVICLAVAMQKYIFLTNYLRLAHRHSVCRQSASHANI